MKTLPSILFSTVVLGLALIGPTTNAKADTPAAESPVAVNRIRPHVGVISSRWVELLPPATRVNYPELLQTVYPSQKIAVVLEAEGPDRAKLLDDITIDLHISSPSIGMAVERGIKPAATKLIKAQGGDVALHAMKIAGIGTSDDQAQLEDKIAMVAYGVFQPTWQVPMLDKAETVQISVTVNGPHAPALCKPAIITIRPTEDWMNEMPADFKQAGRYMNRYYESAAPGHLLGLLKAFADSDHLNTAPVLGFFTAAFRDNPEACKVAVAQFASLDQDTRFVLLRVLRLAGQDTASLENHMTPQQRAALHAVEPIKDPRHFVAYRDPVDGQQIRATGDQMDQCWGSWMATGDSSYLRALVNLLGYAPDYHAYEALAKARGGQQRLNTAVARGLAYQIAGWSIRSFQRTDPLVFDWLDYWKNEPSFPKQLREELTALPDNPAFDRR